MWPRETRILEVVLGVLLHLQLLSFLFSLCIFSLLLEPFEIGFVFAIHEGAESVNLDFEECSLVLGVLELLGVLQEASLDQLALDDLDLADEVDVASPGWLRLLDLLIFVDESNLLLEVLLVFGAVDHREVAPVVELFVIREDVGLRKSSFRRLQEFFIKIDLALAEDVIDFLLAEFLVNSPIENIRVGIFLCLFNHLLFAFSLIGDLIVGSMVLCHRRCLAGSPRSGLFGRLEILSLQIIDLLVQHSRGACWWSSRHERAFEQSRVLLVVRLPKLKYSLIDDMIKVLTRCRCYLDSAISRGRECSSHLRSSG